MRVVSELLRTSLRSQAALAFLLLVFAQAEIAAAHPVSISTSVVDVRSNAVIVEIDILLEDLVLQHALESKSDLFDRNAMESASKKHQKLVARFLWLLDSDGRRLENPMVTIKKSQIGNQPVPQGDLMKRSVTYQLKYSISRRTNFLTIDHSMGGEDAPVPALMDCLVLQDGAIVDSMTQIVSGRPHTVKLDWENPPAKKLSWKAFRARQAKQRDAQLGIGSYSGLHSFLYVNKNAVRHEVLIPLAVLESWIDLQHKDPYFVTVDEQGRMEPSIRKLLKKCVAKINGKDTTPTIKRIQFFGLDIRDFATLAQPRDVSFFQARVGIMLNYSAEEPPERIELKWPLLNERASYLSTRIYPYDGAAISRTIKRDAPELRWSGHSPAAPRDNFAAIPANPSKQKKEITQLILTQLYRSQQASSDVKIYERLAQLASPKLVRELFLQMNRTLILRNSGGAKARVRTVKIKRCETRSESKTSLQVDATWEVDGTVEHWGHIHRRTHVHSAELMLRVKNGNWMLQRFQTTAFRPVSQSISVRK